IALLIVLVLAVAAGVFAATRAVAGPGSLTDRTWTLSSVTVDGHDQALVTSRPITVRFRSQDRRVSGSGGCNSYGGSYLIVGNTLHITNLQMTLMACVDGTTFQADSGVMEQESGYMQALGEIDRYHLDGDVLTLQGSGGRTILGFRSGAGWVTHRWVNFSSRLPQ
ncbi:MAG TPA: META domain-containing protein, partial [Ktedonobacterales bacterium]|nr:META domain-containing protein [Ktedonobacterales bacterium]